MTIKKFLKSSQKLNIQDSNSCLGNLDVIKKLDHNNDYYFISGWIYDKNIKSSLKSLKIFNDSGLPTGVGFFGIKRADISKVFGSSNFAKPRTTVPVFVEERFQALLNYGYNKGYIRGLNCNLLDLPRAAGGDSSSIAYYLERYQTPVSPWVVSEVRGNKVFNLFRFATISDGNAANTEVKISIANMSFGNLTFDILVRDFFDTDNNPVVIEKFTNCTMNPNDNSFVAKKIGTTDGEYELNSKYIMI